MNILERINYEQRASFGRHKKGAFIFTSDFRREKWDIKGPLFAGLEIYHIKGSSVDP
jgi:hypothetical protein